VVQNGAFLGCTPVTLLYCSVLDELMHRVPKTLLLVANWKPFLHCFMDQCSRASHYGTAELGIYLALLHCTCLTFIDIGILENSSAVSISIVTIWYEKGAKIMRSCHNESTTKISRENSANRFLLPFFFILIWEFFFHLKNICLVMVTLTVSVEIS
jgi:hypothetical protein